MKMEISKNFNLSEFLKTSTGIENIPNESERTNLIKLIENVLQPARDELNIPITVTSGFRSKAVNTAVGGVSTSQHAKGEAADIKCSDNKKLFDIIRERGVFDQLIWEFGNHLQPQWIHVSYREGNNRRQVLQAYKDKGKTKYRNM